MVSLCHSKYIDDLSKTSLRPYDTSHTSTTKIRQMVIRLYDEAPAVLMTQSDKVYSGMETSKQMLFSLCLNTSTLLLYISSGNTCKTKKPIIMLPNLKKSETQQIAGNSIAKHTVV